MVLNQGGAPHWAWFSSLVTSLGQRHRLSDILGVTVAERRAGLQEAAVESRARPGGTALAFCPLAKLERRREPKLGMQQLESPVPLGTTRGPGRRACPQVFQGWRFGEWSWIVLESDRAVKTSLRRSMAPCVCREAWLLFLPGIHREQVKVYLL